MIPVSRPIHVRLVKRVSFRADLLNASPRLDAPLSRVFSDQAPHSGSMASGVSVWILGNGLVSFASVGSLNPSRTHFTTWYLFSAVIHSSGHPFCNFYSSHLLQMSPTLRFQLHCPMWRSYCRYAFISCNTEIPVSLFIFFCLYGYILLPNILHATYRNPPKIVKGSFRPRRIHF